MTPQTVDITDLKGSILSLIVLILTSVDYVAIETHTEALLKILVLSISLILGLRALFNKKTDDNEKNFNELENND